MRPPFPNLFPPPEIWDDVPPLSDRKRKIGMAREAAIIVGIGGLVLCGIGKAAIEAVEALRTPTLDHSRSDDITQLCVIEKLAVTGTGSTAQLAADIRYTQLAIGETERYNLGLVYVEGTVASTARSSLYADGMPRMVHAADTAIKDGFTTYRYTASALPNGKHEYRIYMNYDVIQHSDIGGVYDTGMPEHGTVTDYCGRISITKQAGAITAFEITEP